LWKPVNTNSGNISTLFRLLFAETDHPKIKAILKVVCENLSTP